MIIWLCSKTKYLDHLCKAKVPFFITGKSIGEARIFDWGGPKPQITYNDAIRNFWKTIFLWVKAGAYLGGGHWAMAPPFGLLGLQNCIVKWAKLRHGPPLCKLGIRLSGFWLEIWVSSGEKRDGPWVKTFFWRSPDFRQKKPLNFGFRPKNHSEFWRRPFFFFFFLEIT